MDNGYRAFLPPPVRLSNPHCMPSTICTTDRAAEPEASFEQHSCMYSRAE